MAFSPPAVSAPAKKFDFLMQFYDMNEAAYAYHRHCIGGGEAINPTFLKTLDFVANELFAEARAVDPKARPEYIRKKILERRSNMQYKLDVANIKEGCASNASKLAREHYQKFSKTSESEIRDFIQEELKGISD